MLQAPPNVGDILIYGTYDPLNPPYYRHSTFIVESVDKGNYTLRLNSTSFVKRYTKARIFIKQSKDKRVVTDAELAAHYSDASEMLIHELKMLNENYFQNVKVKL